MSDPRQELGRATAHYEQTNQEHERSRKALVAAVVSALRAGVPPSEVVALSPFSAAYVRTLAREHGIPPAPGGLKPRAKRSPGS